MLTDDIFTDAAKTSFNPASPDELRRFIEAFRGFERLANNQDFMAKLAICQRSERWRTDPLELMPYFRRAGEMLNWRRGFWALGDFFNHIGNIGL